MDFHTLQADHGSRLHALGRNGYVMTKGVEVCLDRETITLRPITSKGLPGRCSIELDRKLATELVGLLQHIVDEAEKHGLTTESAMDGRSDFEHLEMQAHADPTIAGMLKRMTGLPPAKE